MIEWVELTSFGREFHRQVRKQLALKVHQAQTFLGKLFLLQSRESEGRHRTGENGTTFFVCGLDRKLAQLGEFLL